MITIKKGKEIREDLGMAQLIIFAIDEKGIQHVVTHGKTVADAREAAAAGNNLKHHLGWPTDLCRSSALERICKNCHFFKPDYGTYCFNGWSGDGSKGNCSLEPRLVQVTQGQGCRQFEPK
jgi:hypothetical protein